MSREEDELRSILDKFRKPIPDLEQLVATLLEARECLNLDRQIATKGALPRSLATQKIQDLVRHLSHCQADIRILNSFLLAKVEPEVLRTFENNSLVLSFLREEPFPDTVQSVYRQVVWFQDVLETIKHFISSNEEAVIKCQNTFASLQEEYLASVAAHCMQAGITLSDSTGSNFFKIAKWFLGVEDPRKVIRKSKTLLLALAKGGPKFLKSEN